MCNVCGNFNEVVEGVEYSRLFMGVNWQFLTSQRWENLQMFWCLSGRGENLENLDLRQEEIWLWGGNNFMHSSQTLSLLFVELVLTIKISLALLRWCFKIVKIIISNLHFACCAVSCLELMKNSACLLARLPRSILLLYFEHDSRRDETVEFSKLRLRIFFHDEHRRRRMFIFVSHGNTIIA